MRCSWQCWCPPPRVTPTCYHLTGTPWMSPLWLNHAAAVSAEMHCDICKRCAAERSPLCTLRFHECRRIKPVQASCRGTLQSHTADLYRRTSAACTVSRVFVHLWDVVLKGIVCACAFLGRTQSQAFMHFHGVVSMPGMHVCACVRCRLLCCSDMKIFSSHNRGALINTPKARVNPSANKRFSLIPLSAFSGAERPPCRDVRGVLGRAPTWHMDSSAWPAVLMRSNRYTVS